MVKLGMDKQMVTASFNEGIIQGFGKLLLNAKGAEGDWLLEQYPKICTLHVTCGVAGDERIIALSCAVTRLSDIRDNDYDWVCLI